MPPGQEGKITLAIEHTESYQGEVSKSASVQTNDPVYSSFNLSLRGYFKSDRPPMVGPPPPAMVSRRAGPFTMLPNDRWITSVLTGTSTSTRLSLFNPEANPVHIKKLVAGGTNFNVTLNTIEDGKRYELAITTNPALKPGQYEQTVQISTDSAQAPEASVVLGVTVFARTFFRPMAINVQPLSLDSDLSAVNIPMIYVQKLRETGLTLKSISSSLPFIKLEVMTDKEGESYSIRLKIDKSLIPGVGRFSGKIRIETNDPDVPFAEIPIQLAFN
ncbi:MAG TPA: hypothetical protein VF131_14985 [Blastocatellia bacterium]|nr:hypothetical protein [Blastocatellia bacterium]